jgi:hypothetical protein
MRKDQAELDAEALLDSLDYNGSHNQLITNAVAAELREKDIEIEQYKAENLFLNKGHEQLLAEIEKLRAQLKAEADLDARELLPCNRQCHGLPDSLMHDMRCPWNYRPAVAAALRKLGEENDMHKQLWKDAEEVYGLSVRQGNKLNAELAQAQTEIKRLKYKNDSLREQDDFEIAALRSQLAEAREKDDEIAKLRAQAKERE